MTTLSFGERFVRSAWRLTPQRALSQIIGWGARCSLPRGIRESLIASFARKYGIDVSEAEKPIGEYCGLHDFFTRRLRPDARPVDPRPEVVVSPADGTVVDVGTVVEGKLLEAKGSAFRLSDLLADGEAAAKLEGGAYAITYLSPRDYHRVHAPVAGRIVAWHHVPGKLFPVNNRSFLREPGLFAKNERFVTLIESEMGLCAVVMVAAVGVGHITAAYDADVTTHTAGFSDGGVRHKKFDQPVAIERAGELGIFHLGSTTIVVFEPGRVTLDPMDVGSTTRMGAAMGRVVRSSPQL